MKTQPTTDYQYRMAFFQLLLSKLTECFKGTDPDDLTFSPTEEKVAEYYCKDLASEGVPEHLSPHECTSCLKRRITRLIDHSHGNHNSEWENVQDFVEKHARNLSPDDIIRFHNTKEHFTGIAV